MLLFTNTLLVHTSMYEAMQPHQTLFHDTRKQCAT